MARLWDSWIAKGIAFVAGLALGLLPILLLPQVRAWAHREGPILLGVSIAALITALLLLGTLRTEQREAPGPGSASNPQSAVATADDQHLLERLLRLLPATGGPIPLLRDGYPLGSFILWASLEPLAEFERDWGAPTNRFRDAPLEARRDALHIATCEYLTNLRVNSFVDHDPGESYIPKEWTNYLQVVREIQDQSIGVAEHYDSLIAEARAQGFSVREPKLVEGPE